MAPTAVFTRERRFNRVRARLPIRYGLNSPEHADFAETLSEGGLYINTNRVFRVGTRLRLRIEFPERPVAMRGEVVWAIQAPEHLRGSMVCGMGISFLDPEPDWPPFFRKWKNALDAGDESVADAGCR